MSTDFLRDVALRCNEMLLDAGYHHNLFDDHDILRLYSNVKNRRVPTRPRKLHKAPYSVPEHIAIGEQQLLEKVVKGQDLWPHQSRKIESDSFEDGMLNDYGIQHFHLGTVPDGKRPRLIKGTCELLFAVVKNDDFYALGIFDHKSWSKSALLDIMQTNWPKLIEPSCLKGVVGLAQYYTDEEAAELRKNNINVITKGANGSFRISPGGGITSNGKSFRASRESDRFQEHVEQLQRTVVDRMMRSGASPATPIRLEWENGVAFAVSSPCILETKSSPLLKMKLDLNVPPL